MTSLWFVFYNNEFRKIL